MAESNGELMEDSTNPKPEDRGDGERTDDYPKLLSYGLDKKVSVGAPRWPVKVEPADQMLIALSIGCWQTRRYL
jgi:hypothetical protein